MRALRAFAAVSCLLAGPALGQPCPAVTQQTGLKVVLDDFRPLSTAAFDVPVLMERVRSAFVMRLAKLCSDRSLNLRTPIYCNRFRQEGDFKKSEIADLNDYDVVVEIWGTLLADTEDGAPKREAVIRYELIPVHHYASDFGDWPLRFERTVRIGGVPLEAFRKALGADRALDAFLLSAAALKALKGSDYERAKKLFCSSQLLLTRPSTPAAGTPEADLLDRVKALVVRTVDEARADDTYKGLLSLPTAAGCGS